MCVAEHPEDKQLPVCPAAGHSCSVCHHPQLTPTGPGLLRHAHLLQYCGLVWTHSPPRLKTNSLSETVCTTLCWFLFCFSAAHCAVTEMWAGFSVCVCGCFLFLQSTPWAVQRSLPYRASALLGSHWAPCRHGNSINWARQLLILWCE